MPKQKRTNSRPKSLYRVQNWSESEDFQKVWLHEGEKQRGRQLEYSDKAIEIMLTIKEVFRLTNRGVEGFVRSLFQLMNVNLPVPDHSRSRNAARRCR